MSSPGEGGIRPAAAVPRRPGGSISDHAAVEVYLDVAAFQLPSNELLGEGVFDELLDGPAER